MQQPDHDLRIATATQSTPRRIISLLFVGGLHLILIYALISGLATSMVKKGLEELKVATVEEAPKIKPPPPPPPPMELPPPPFVPPPDVVIDVPMAAPPVTVTHTPPAPIIQAPVTTPVSIGRPHACGANLYPDVSLRNKEEGTTTVGFTVETDGSVAGPAVENSSGHPRLDEAALGCVSRWKYKPATQNGQPIAAKSSVAIKWQLPR